MPHTTDTLGSECDDAIKFVAEPSTVMGFDIISDKLDCVKLQSTRAPRESFWFHLWLEEWGESVA